jgi:pantoate--beta-alanine ligase
MTKLFTDLQAWREERRAQCRAGTSLGFVPTMGALHEGHLSLVQRSGSENDATLVSIFVNPTQFDDRVDYEKYPRSVDDDMRMLRAAEADYVLLPTQADLYPDAFRYRVSEVDRSRTLEGAHRPGHFDAVLTVVLKLLQLARAERAYFGEKDWQQLQLVRGMADAFFLSTVIVPVGTVREDDGLALSSRNRRLAATDRAKAPAFHRALLESASPDEATRVLRDGGFVVDYVEDVEGRRLGAVRLGGVRLIDNVALNGGPEGPHYSGRPEGPHYSGGPEGPPYEDS